MKILVTKLQESVDNDNLPYFNGVVIELMPPYSDRIYFGDSIDRNNPCYIKLFNGKFPDNSVEKPIIGFGSTLVPDNESKKILALLYPFDKLRVGPIDDKARAKNIQDVFDWVGAGTTGLYFNYSYGYGDIEAVKNLTALITLKLSGTNVSGDISAVKNLTALTTLKLSGTNVSGDISAVKNLTALTTLSLGNTNVSGDISALSGLTRLDGISLEYTPNITGDISSIMNLPNIKFVRLPDTIAHTDEQVKTLTDKGITVMFTTGR